MECAVTLLSKSGTVYEEQLIKRLLFYQVALSENVQWRYQWR